MSTYKRYSTEGSPVLVLSDRNIYGSSRVGVEDVHMELAQQAVSSSNTGMEPVPGTTRLFNSGETSLGSTWTRQSSCSTAVVMSNSGGMLQITDVCPTQYDFMQPTEIGREYRFEADFDVSQASSLFITFLAQSPGCLPPAVYGQNLVVTTGHFSYTFTATTDCSRISIRNYGTSSNGGTFKIDNISFLRGSMNVVTVSNQVGDKHYELANHLGNVLNVVTDRKLIQAPADETVFEDRFNTPGDLLGWHYDPVLAQEPVPSGYSLTNPSGKLVVNPGSASSYGSVIKSVQFLQGVHYTLSFDAVLSTNQGAVLAGSSSGTLLIADFLTTGSHSFNFVGDGSFGYIAFLMLPNVVYQYDNIKLVANDVQTVTADVKTYSDYYPYGMQLPKRHGEDVYRYGFNGMEKDNEIKTIDGSSYDFVARMYDSRLGRWLSVDAHTSKYPNQSPYSFVNNSPITSIDPDGKDVIIVIWYPEKGAQGHTAIAVENYKEKLDENGNVVYEEIMGADNVVVKKPVMEKDGTYTYYDFWPAKNVPENKYMSDVTSDPNKKQVKSVDLLLETDQSMSNEQGNLSVGGEGRAPDVAYRIETTQEQDQGIVQRLDKLQTRKYNAQSLNCTTFSIEGLRGGFENKVVNDLGNETIKVGVWGAAYGYPESVSSNTPTALSRSLNALAKKTEAGKLKSGEPSVSVEKESTIPIPTKPYVDIVVPPGSKN
jgi:RHS repeat-associated protein